MSERRVRILCVDDHSVVREGIAAIIGKTPDLEMVGVAANGRDAVSEYQRQRPDVVLMDLQLPLMSGLDAIRRIRMEDSAARIVVLTMYGGAVDIRRALDAGASAYLLKDTLADHLVRTIRDVWTRDAMRPQASARNRNASALTQREEEVMRLLAIGMRNKEIGADMGITKTTVDAHIRNIFSKLQVNDRTAAMAAAIRLGIIHIE